MHYKSNASKSKIAFELSLLICFPENWVIGFGCSIFDLQLPPLPPLWENDRNLGNGILELIVIN